MPASITRKCGRILRDDSRGQGLIEYALILMFIVMVVIMLIRGIGSSTSNMYSTVNSAVSGASQ